VTDEAKSQDVCLQRFY